MLKKIIIGLICLGLSLVLIFVFVLPLWSAVRESSRFLDEKQEILTATEELLRETERLRQEYQSVSQQANQFLLALPQEEDIPHLLVQLEGMASANGLLLESIQFDVLTEESQEKAPVLAAGLNILPVRITVSGSYEAMKNLLVSLEKSFRPMDIYSIDFSAGQRKDEPVNLGVYSYNLSLGVYYTQ